MNQLPHYHDNPPPAENYIRDAHVYFALAMILSVMFLFTGIGILTLLCLLPAIVYAEQVRYSLIVMVKLINHPQYFTLITGVITTTFVYSMFNYLFIGSKSQAASK